MKKMHAAVPALMISVLLFSCGHRRPAAATDITLWYSGAVSEAGAPPTDWKILDIIREELDINLKIEMLPTSQPERAAKISAAAAADRLPDLFNVNRDIWNKLIRTHQIAPVDDMYSMMPERTALMYDDDSIAFTTVHGSSYGFANPGSLPRCEAMLIRKDWLDNLQLAVPVTTEEFFSVMKAFTYNDPDQNGEHDTWGFGAFLEIYDYQEGLGRRFEPIFGAFGAEGTWDMSAAHPGLSIRKPGYFDALCYINAMIKEGVIDPNWPVYKKENFRTAWKQGRFGIMREQNAAFAAESNYLTFDKNFPHGEWIVIDPPKGPDGFQSNGVYTQTYRILAVSKKAADAGKKQAIAHLLEWMGSGRGYYLLSWGEEGVQYTLNGRGIPVPENLPDPEKSFTKPAMQPYMQLRSLALHNSRIEVESRYPPYTAPYSGKQMNAFDVMLDMKQRPHTPAIGSETMPLPDADLKRYYEQSVVDFVLGRRPLTKTDWIEWLVVFDRLGGAQWEQLGISYGIENGLIH